MNERNLARKWIEEHRKGHPSDYAIRIHDCPWEVKPFDYILFCGRVSWAMEFKVDRRKSFQYTVDELPAHQRRELSLFSNGKSRRSMVMVYHPETGTWNKLEVTCARS